MKEIEKMLEMAKKGYEAEITNIEKMNSLEFFGESQYDDREGYKVSFKLFDTDADDPVEWNEFFAIPKPRGFVKSKIGMFCTRYGQIPSKGLKVQAEIDTNGFFGCKL